jgi:feruloyl esterase
MGKEFTTALYARSSGAEKAISRSYFNGCSGGGRDAMVAASHFPEAFDGIIAGSPYDTLGMPFHISAVGVMLQRAPEAKLSPAHISTLDGIVKAQCDTLDGVKDGVIQNPAACNFNPERDLPLCKSGESGGQCFNQAQIDTISVATNAVTNEHGNIVQPGYSISEYQSGNPMISALTDPMHKVFARKNDPNFKTDSLFRFQRGGPGPVKGLHAVVNTSDVALHRSALASGGRMAPDKMTRMKKAGTKLLIWHNWSDELLTPYSSINWYTGFAKNAGGYAKAQNQARLFMLPGTTHCSISGVAPNSFDSIGALEKWVEKGEAPNRLMANVAERQFTPGVPKAVNLAFPDWTMPLCKFPEMARYSGKGNVKDGANWSCPSGNKGLLKMGASGISAGMQR